VTAALRGGLIVSTLLVIGCVDRYALPPPRLQTRQSEGSPALHREAVRELAAMRTTSYTHETRVAEDRGLFEYDCSGFVDYAISNVSSEALDALRSVRGTKRLTARTYVELLSAIPTGSTRRPWRRLERVSELLPGDVIAWLLVEHKRDFLGNANTGHVMIVDEAPHETEPGEWVVPVIDSSFSSHGGLDPRHQPDQTGLGRGTVVLVTDHDQLTGYRLEDAIEDFPNERRAWTHPWAERAQRRIAFAAGYAISGSFRLCTARAAPVARGTPAGTPTLLTIPPTRS